MGIKKYSTPLHPHNGRKRNTGGGLIMQVTDEMLQVALAHEDMKSAIEAAIQAAWVKLDMSDPNGRPFLNQDVLIVTANGQILKSALRERLTGFNNTILTWEGFYWIDNFKPTHWMPLPEFNGE